MSAITPIVATMAAPNTNRWSFSSGEVARFRRIRMLSYFGGSYAPRFMLQPIKVSRFLIGQALIVGIQAAVL